MVAVNKGSNEPKEITICGVSLPLQNIRVITGEQGLVGEPGLPGAQGATGLFLTGLLHLK